MVTESIITLPCFQITHFQILVHGERNEMERLRASLAAQHTRPDGSAVINIIAPKLCQVVELGTGFQYPPLYS